MGSNILATRRSPERSRRKDLFAIRYTSDVGPERRSVLVCSMAVVNSALHKTYPDPAIEFPPLGGSLGSRMAMRK